MAVAGHLRMNHGYDNTPVVHPGFQQIGGMLFYKSSTNNSLRGQKVAIGSKNDLSTKKKFISGLPKYPTGPRSTVGLNLKNNQKNQNILML